MIERLAGLILALNSDTLNVTMLNCLEKMGIFHDQLHKVG